MRLAIAIGSRDLTGELATKDKTIAVVWGGTAGPFPLFYGLIIIIGSKAVKGIVAKKLRS